MTCLALRSIGTCRGVAALALAFLALADGPAQAQTNLGAFTLKITEKEMKLEHPSDNPWNDYLMWDLPFKRMNDRNMPYLELTNDPDSTAPIVEFRLTIGDTRFQFSDDALGTFAMLGRTTPGFDLMSSTVGNLGDELVVKIGNGGLQPGDLVRFKIDLDVDPQFLGQFFAHPDYRTVLFDMNGVNVYDGFLEQESTADNAKVWAIFDPASGANFTVGPWALLDEEVNGDPANYFNNHYRRYRDMDPIGTFLVAGEVSTIPEPGSFVLAVVGVVGGLWLASQSRSVVRTA